MEQLISQFTNKRLTVSSQQRRQHDLILPCKILLTHSTKGVCFLADMQLSLVFNYQYKWQTSIDDAWDTSFTPFPFGICMAALISSIIIYWCTTLSLWSGFPKHGSWGYRMQGYLGGIDHWPNWTWTSSLQEDGDGETLYKTENHTCKQAVDAEWTGQTRERIRWPVEPSIPRC